MAESARVALNDLRREPYSTIMCYPRLSNDELERRIHELSGLGISALEFQGPRTVLGVRMLGKGCVGLVVSAQGNKGRVALKILRTDADRHGFEHEASMLRLANSVNVGPRLLNFSNKFMVMEYLEGRSLPEWVEELAGRGRKSRLKTVLGKILEACYILDQIGLDHGELSRAPKHIIVSRQDEPEIVDFETASTNRKPSNVTSIAQYLFIGSNLSARVRRILGPIQRRTLVAQLRQYKKDGKIRRFQQVLKAVSCEDVPAKRTP